MTESLTVEYDKTGFVREPTGPLLPQDRAQQRLPLERRQVGRDRGQPRHALEAPGRAHGPRRSWGDDPRFADHTARGEHQDLLDEMIGEWAAGTRPTELDEIVNAAGVVCAPVYTAADIHGDPWFRERGLVVEWEDEVHGTIAGNGVVPKLMGTPGGVRHGARWTVGADNDDVLGELGLSAEEIAELRDGSHEHRHANEGRLMAFRLGVDVGGTFTDLFLVNDADDRQFRVKTPSTPADPSLGVLTGVKRICAEAGIAPSELRNIVHGTTVATNAVLESKGARVGLITTHGLQADPAPRALADAGAAGGLDHHDQARPAGAALGHARGGRAPRRARQRRHAGRPRAGQGHRARPRRLRRRVAHRSA